MFHRAPGSIGASAYPSRVLQGMRGAGTWAPTRDARATSRSCGVDVENNLLLVRGSVPGAGGCIVVIRKS